MKTCNTCRWWSASDRQLSDGMAVCGSPYLVEAGCHGDVSDIAERGLEYCYNEGGGFYTGPLFGCVHHEPRT